MYTNKLISVIVPVYNVEQYVSACVDSILSQSYKNIEIILVNDGSQDNSRQICEDYLKSDSRIILINKENGGLSDARNKGIECATGDYLAFIDSDDIIHRDYLKIMSQNIGESDIAICRLKKFTIQEPDNSLPISERYEELSGFEMNEFLFHEKLGIHTIVATNKLYRRTLWSHLRFPIGRLHEDCAVIYLILNQAKSVKLLDSELYFYRMREDSITSYRSFKSIADEYHALSQQVSFFKKNGQNQIVKNANRSRKALFLHQSLDTNWSVWRNYSINSIIKDDLRTKIKIRLILRKLFPKLFNRFL